MKIEGPRRTETKSVSKTTKPHSAHGTSFSAHLASFEAEDTSVSSFGGVSGVVGIDALISAQSVDDTADKKSRSYMIKRADSILDELESLRLSLLLGELTFAQIENLSKRVAVQKNNISDPHLRELLDEIDMRAQIEMAKFGR